MRFLFLNQTFHPDVVPTAQYLSEVALELAQKGHQVTVLTSRRAYDHPEIQFAKTDEWRGIRIIRIGSTGLGKTEKWRRTIDFSSFLLGCAARMAVLPRQDVVVALTSPPLVSVLGAFFSKIRGGRFLYWIMDFNPDEAVAAGWLRQGGLAAKALEALSRFSLRAAGNVIALDRFMKERIRRKGIDPDKVLVLPPWSYDDTVAYDPAGRERFRKAHGLDGKFVVMYSGNHSPCHPLDSLLEAAQQLKSDREIVFCFIGGGSEWRRIEERVRSASADNFRNVILLPYQPLADLSASLSAADLHVVVMGEQFVGLVHPCKIYNIFAVRAPVLCIGPQPSHLSELISRLPPGYPARHVRHGQPHAIISCIRELQALAAQAERPNPADTLNDYSRASLLPRFVEALEGESEPRTIRAEVAS